MDKKAKEQIQNAIYKTRKETLIKSECGRCLLIGGSKNYPLAPLIAEKGASCIGLGYVSLAVPDSIYEIAATRASLTTIFAFLPQAKDSFIAKKDELLALEKYDAILFGNGILESKENYDFLSSLLKTYPGYLVLDATALTLLSKYGEDILSKKKGKEVILTPHLGEANRLFHTSLSSHDAKDYLESAKAFCETYSVHLLLKSYAPIYVTPNDFCFSASPASSVLGKAGSGDGLAGYLTGLLAFPMKDVTLQDKVLFADEIIHEKAKEIEREGHCNQNILDVLNRLYKKSAL